MIGLAFGIAGLILGLIGFIVWLRGDRQHGPGLHFGAIAVSTFAIVLNLLLL